MTDIHALEAHARLARLPTYRHSTEPEARGPSSLVGYPTEGRRPGRAAAEDSPLRRNATRAKQIAAEARAATARRKRASPEALPANKLRAKRGDALQVADDGGSWAGCRVEYAGMASSTWCYVIASGMKVSVRLDRLGRAAS